MKHLANDYTIPSQNEAPLVLCTVDGSIVEYAQL